MKVLVRSSGHFVLLTVLQKGGFLADEGLDVIFALSDMHVDADRQLLSGEVDMISGSHHTPYLHFDDGKPMAILASSTNAVQEFFVSNKPISDLSEMRGHKLALSPLLKPGEHPSVPAEGHPRSNIQIILERAGIADAVDFLGYGPDKATSKVRFDSVVSGWADGAFASFDETSAAKELGLHVLELEPLPMITGVTLTTTWTKVKEHEADHSFERFVRALQKAVKFFIEDRDGTLAILKDSADELNIRDEAHMIRRYERGARELVPSLAPTAEAIKNAFRIAEMERPGIENRVNPLMLWDLHYVRLAQAGLKSDA